MFGCLLVEYRLHFFGQRFPDVWNHVFFASSELLKVGSGLSETERAIWAASNYIGVLVILTVILPKAYRANLIMIAPMKRFEFATRTTVGNGFFPIFIYRMPFAIFRLFRVHIIPKYYSQQRRAQAAERPSSPAAGSAETEVRNERRERSCRRSGAAPCSAGVRRCCTS